MTGQCQIASCVISRTFPPEIHNHFPPLFRSFHLRVGKARGFKIFRNMQHFPWRDKTPQCKSLISVQRVRERMLEKMWDRMVFVTQWGYFTWSFVRDVGKWRMIELLSLIAYPKGRRMGLDRCSMGHPSLTSVYSQ